MDCQKANTIPMAPQITSVGCDAEAGSSGRLPVGGLTYLVGSGMAYRSKRPPSENNRGPKGGWGDFETQLQKSRYSPLFLFLLILLLSYLLLWTYP